MTYQPVECTPSFFNNKVFDVENSEVKKIDNLYYQIDNVLKYPIGLRNLILNIPSQLDDIYEHPGFINYLNYNFSKLQLFNVFEKFIKKIDPLFRPYKNKFYQSMAVSGCFINSKILPTDVHTLPHIDVASGYAGVLYLNDPKDCHGGTSFYDNDLNFITSSEMVFNRLILYPANIYHSAYMIEEYTDTWRITLNFMLPSVLLRF